MNSEQSRLAAKFVKDNKIKRLDSELLKTILQNKGFSIVSFSRVVNDDRTELMLKSLFGVNAENMPSAVSADGKKGKFVFLCDELNQRDELYALCVQTGLILCGNACEKPNDTKVEAQRKAHEFAKSLCGICGGDVFEKARAFPMKTAAKSVAAAVFLLLFCFSVCFCTGFYVCRLNYESSAVQVFSSYGVSEQNETYADDNTSDMAENDISGVLTDADKTDKKDALFDENGNRDNAVFYGTQTEENVFLPKNSGESANTEHTEPQAANVVNEKNPEPPAAEKTAADYDASQAHGAAVYYITSNGTKYHKAGCSYIANKDNLKEIRSDSAELSKYSPCSRCFK